MLVNISPSGLDSYSFARALLEGYRVGVAPGAAFGNTTEGWVRISLAADDEVLVEGLGRLADFVCQGS